MCKLQSVCFDLFYRHRKIALSVINVNGLSYSHQTNFTQYDNLIPLFTSSLICVLIEKDEGVSKLGGESSKVLAHEVMTKTAEAFFKLEPPTFTGIWDQFRQDTFHKKIEALSNSSRLQIIAAPLTIVYEEGSLSDTTFGVNFLMKLTMSLGRVSIKEVIVAPTGSPHVSSTIDMITFTENSSSDFKLIYEVLCRKLYS